MSITYHSDGTWRENNVSHSMQSIIITNNFDDVQSQLLRSAECCAFTSASSAATCSSSSTVAAAFFDQLRLLCRPIIDSGIEPRLHAALSGALSPSIAKRQTAAAVCNAGHVLTDSTHLFQQLGRAGNDSPYALFSLCITTTWNSTKDYSRDTVVRNNAADMFT